MVLGDLGEVSDILMISQGAQLAASPSPYYFIVLPCPSRVASPDHLHTGNPALPMAKSNIDYVIRWLALRFLPEIELANFGIVRAKQSNPQTKGAANSEDPLFSDDTNTAVLKMPTLHQLWI